MSLSNLFEACARYALPGKEKDFLENTIGVFASKKFRKEIEQEFGSYMQQVSWKTMMETKVMRQISLYPSA